MTGDENAAGAERDGTRLGRNFFLLFFLCLFANSFNAIYYCFEQWLEQAGVDPGWRGVLLGSIAGVVLVVRPAASVAVLRLRLRPVLSVSLVAIGAVMLSYRLVPPGPAFVWTILALRLAQGFFIAVFSACTVAMLALCIPPKRSAMGFALFTLTFLLPNAILPTVGEILLPVLGGETGLYAASALLSVPALFMVRMLGPLLDAPLSSAAGSFGEHAKRMLSGILHSGLGWVYLSNCAFSMCIFTCLFFMKGLCSVTGELPGRFFFFYSLTIALVRLFFSGRLDGLRRMPVVLVSALAMGASAFIIAWGPSWTYESFSVVYGLAISLLYPLLFATVFERSRPELRAVASNIAMLTGDVAALAAPLLGGAALAMGVGYRGVITLAACFAAGCGLLFGVDGLLRGAGGGRRSPGRRPPEGGR